MAFDLLVIFSFCNAPSWDAIFGLWAGRASLCIEHWKIYILIHTHIQSLLLLGKRGKMLLYSKELFSKAQMTNSCKLSKHLMGGCLPPLLSYPRLEAKISVKIFAQKFVINLCTVKHCWKKCTNSSLNMPSTASQYFGENGRAISIMTDQKMDAIYYRWQPS